MYICSSKSFTRGRAPCRLIAVICYSRSCSSSLCQNFLLPTLAARLINWLVGARRLHDYQLADADKGLDSGCCTEHLLQGAVIGRAGMPVTNFWVPAGFMITNWLMRTRGMALAVALKTFAEHRPAGIYKEDYIRALYKYYHEPL